MAPAALSAPLGCCAASVPLGAAALDCAVSVPLGVVEVTGGLLLAAAALVSLLAVELVAPGVEVAAEGAAAALGLLSGVVVVVVVVVEALPDGGVFTFGLAGPC